MGAKLCCLGLTKSKRQDNDPTGQTPSSAGLQWQDLLVPLAPNITVGRNEAQLPPQSLMSVSVYVALQRHIPPHVQRRKLELVYASWEHGFSLTAFRSALSERQSSRHASVNQEVFILVRPSLTLPSSPSSTSRTNASPASPPQLLDSTSRTAAGGTQSSPTTDKTFAASDDAPLTCAPVIGAFLPTGIDFQCKKYHGADTMFVFTTIVENKSSVGVVQSSYGSVDAASSYSSATGNFTVVDIPTVYTCRSPKVNEYFVRTTDGMVVFGGGGKGAAMSINDDLDTVTSSFMCPTFGSSCLLPVERGAGPDAVSPSGVQVEGFHSKAPIHTLEVWGISNFPLTIPAEDEARYVTVSP